MKAMESWHQRSIHSRSVLCVKGYKNLLDLLTELSPEKALANKVDIDQARGIAHEESQRFRSWSSGSGSTEAAHAMSSLESRLKNSPAISQRISQILNEIEEYLEDATLIVSGERENETWRVDSISDSDNSSEADGSIDHEGCLKTSELEELLLGMKSANTGLARLAVVMRNSPANDDYLKAATRYNFDPRYDIGHVQEKHGAATGSSDWLIERLGRGITRRRKFLKYRQEHYERLASDWDDTPKDSKVNVKDKEELVSTEEVETKQDEEQQPEEYIGSIEEPINLWDEDARSGYSEFASFGSQTSYEATVGEDASHGLSVPPHPEMAFDGIAFRFGEPFQCPYCYTEQLVKNKLEWKKHVFQDLRPYVCTFRECDLRMFFSRNEWFAHELQVHRRQWACPFCSLDASTKSLARFNTTSALESHMISAHEALYSRTQLEALLSRSESTVDRISASACKLCDDWGTNLTRPHKESNREFLNEGKTVEPSGTLKQFRRHLARHMEQLALFALPVTETEEAEDDSSDEDDDSDLPEHNEETHPQNDETQDNKSTTFQWRRTTA